MQKFPSPHRPDTIPGESRAYEHLLQLIFIFHRIECREGLSTDREPADRRLRGGQARRAEPGRTDRTGPDPDRHARKHDSWARRMSVWVRRLHLHEREPARHID